MSFLAPIAGAVVGGLMSDGGGSQTASKEPWSEAAPMLKYNLKRGQELQKAYEQNPFNSLQQTAYQNQFSNLDRFNNDLTPALMRQISGLLGSNFQLPQSYQQGPQPQQAPTGLLSPPQTAQTAQYAKPSFGLIDWTALNPYTNGSIPAEPAKNPAADEEERKRREQEALMQAYMNSERGSAGA
jgi:hypothetical protein